MKAAPATTSPPMKAAMTAATGARVETPRAAKAIWNESPWKWFFSLGVGVTLLIAITIASIIGTMIDPLPRAQALIYYTWWFKLLLLALAVVMSCSTVKTILVKILPAHELRVRTQKSFYEHAPLRAKIPYHGQVEDVARAFQRQGFRVRSEGDAGAARTGWIGRFGAPVSHLGLVIVLLAGFVASWVAREGLVQIPEGRSASSMQMNNDLEKIVPLGFVVSLDDFSTGFFPRTRIPSHYTSMITARRGNEVLYSGPVEVNHSPKINGWRLHQTSYQELPNLARYEVTVAGAALPEPVPLKISPGQTLPVPGVESTELTLDTRMNWTLMQGRERVATGTLGSGLATAGKLSLLANRFEPDFVLGEDRQVTSRSENLNNPALNVTLLRDGSPLITQWLFGREDMRAFSHSTGGDLKLELLDVQPGEAGYNFVVSVTDSASGAVIARSLLVLGEEQSIDPHAGCTDHDHEEAVVDEAAIAAAGDSGWEVTLGRRVPAYATVLSVTRNPAIPTIYFGCGVMMLGLLLSFFVPRREVWFLLDREKGLLSVVAHYRHLSESFDRATTAALAQITRTESALVASTSSVTSKEQ